MGSGEAVALGTQSLLQDPNSINLVLLPRATLRDKLSLRKLQISLAEVTFSKPLRLRGVQGHHNKPTSSPLQGRFSEGPLDEVSIERGYRNSLDSALATS